MKSIILLVALSGFACCAALSNDVSSLLRARVLAKEARSLSESLRPKDGEGVVTLENEAAWTGEYQATSVGFGGVCRHGEGNCLPGLACKKTGIRTIKPGFEEYAGILEMQGINDDTLFTNGVCDKSDAHCLKEDLTISGQKNTAGFTHQCNNDHECCDDYTCTRMFQKEDNYMFSFLYADHSKYKFKWYEYKYCVRRGAFTEVGPPYWDVTGPQPYWTLLGPQGTAGWYFAEADAGAANADKFDWTLDWSKTGSMEAFTSDLSESATSTDAGMTTTGAGTTTTTTTTTTATTTTHE